MANKTVKVDQLKELRLIAETMEMQFEQKREADEALKKLKERALEIINKNPKLVFEGAKSVTISNVVIAQKEDNTYTVNEGFDLPTFYSRYPKAIKFSISHSGCKNIELDKWDIEHSVTSKIDFSYKKPSEN